MIRIGLSSDAVALRRSCFSATPLDVIESWLDPAEEPDRVLLVGTDTAGDAVATCTLSRRRHRLERHRAEIGGFVIAPDHRGTGMARRLVEACTSYAVQTWGARTIELAVRGGTHAEDAYRGLGFTEWARLPGGLHDGDEIYDDVRLYLPLPPSVRRSTPTTPSDL